MGPSSDLRGWADGEGEAGRGQWAGVRRRRGAGEPTESGGRSQERKADQGGLVGGVRGYSKGQ